MTANNTSTKKVLKLKVKTGASKN